MNTYASTLFGTVLALAISADLSLARSVLPSDDNESYDQADGTFFYETNYQSGDVQAFSAAGLLIGVVAKVSKATGLALDSAGNLFVASDDSVAGFSIRKIAPNGTMSVFATTGLKAPHGIAFDQAGNLYVANASGDWIQRFTPSGVGTVFADSSDGLKHPTALLFDSEGNLFVTNAFGGPKGTGSVETFTPDGTGSIFADKGFSTAYGLAIDSSGNVYVSNMTGNTVERFAPDGTDLGIFAGSPLQKPHGMAFDAAGNLYVANNVASTIEKFSPTGNYLGPFCKTEGGPHFIVMLSPQ